MTNQHNGGCGHEHDDDETPLSVELEAAGQVLLEMRAQNLELIRIASQIAGYAGEHAPLKPNELRQAMNSIWDVFSQLYQWVDPEDAGEEGEDEGDDDE